jgi:hypothetical protein
MKKIGICFMLFVSALIAFCAFNSSADGIINVVNYSLKPVGYVENNKFLQTMYNVEIKNSDTASHSFNFKVVFFDKEKNQIKESIKKVEIQASETKKYSDAVLVEADLAKQIASTKGYVENIQ